jgi:hypothetical protein
VPDIIYSLLKAAALNNPKSKIQNPKYDRDC